uniref:Uncharacterized protein n=1 Tax=Amphimedon queenslandica TaxID=400682 RepID=A0A1X7UUK0_AMPQE
LTTPSLCLSDFFAFQQNHRLGSVRNGNGPGFVSHFYTLVQFDHTFSLPLGLSASQDRQHK